MLQNITQKIPYPYRKHQGKDINLYTLTKKQTKSLSLFCTGFIVYTLGYIASVSDTGISPPACQGIEAVGLILLIAGASGLMKWQFDNKYLQSVFTIYFVFLISIVLRGNKFDYNALKTFFFDMNFSIMTYFAPLAILLPRNLGLYKKIISIPLVLGIFAILYTAYFYKILSNPNWTDRESLGYAEGLFLCLTFPMGFVLMTYLYYSKKIRWFALIVMTIGLYFLIYRARRGAMFICLTTMAGAGMVYLIYTKRWALVISLSVVILLVSTVFAANVKLPSMFDFLMSRKDEDTRSGVEKEMIADMKPADWVVGKGINGTYYCTIVIDDINDLSFQRKVIETGYLQIILKGGIVSLALMGLILIPAVFLALFKSSNMLSKAAGIFILLWMIYTYPAVVNGFHIVYVFLWMCCGIAYSKKIRALSDETIMNYLHD